LKGHPEHAGTGVSQLVTYEDPADGTAPQGFRVRVEPSGIEVVVPAGETLMAAAERAGYRWPTVCHGQAICTACSIVLEKDDGAFESPAVPELQALALFAGRSFYEGKVVRLACQARPRRDTAVVKRGVHRRDSRA
jgi:2Fe-2S ferredoxin